MWIFGDIVIFLIIHVYFGQPIGEVALTLEIFVTGFPSPPFRWRVLWAFRAGLPFGKRRLFCLGNAVVSKMQLAGL